MNWLKKLLEKKTTPSGPTQAVIVHVEEAQVPADVFEREPADVADDLGVTALGERLEALLGDRGEFDGYEFGESEIVLYLYGPDAEWIFDTIAPTLKATPLIRDATVTIRRGEPGAPERVVRLSGQ